MEENLCKKIGEMIGEIENSADRIDFVPVHNETPQKVVEICENSTKINKLKLVWKVH